MHMFTINTGGIVKNTNFEKVVSEEVGCCVVALIGKSKVGENARKQLLHSLGVTSDRFFENGHRAPLKSFHIDSYFIKEERTVLLHLSSLLNVDNLSAVCEEMKTKANIQQSLKVMEHNQVKALLIIFSISHLIIVNHPGSTFDISYIRLFQLLETLRLLLKPVISHLLMTECLGIPSKWVECGRPCSPRVVFVFQHCHLSNQIAADEDQKERVSHRELQLAMEDVIYKIMRKDRIVTDISINSLFAIPANQEFVFMQDDPDSTNGRADDPVTYFSHVLADICHYTSNEILPKIKKYSAKRPQNNTHNNQYGKEDIEIPTNTINPQTTANHPSKTTTTSHSTTTTPHHSKPTSTTPNLKSFIESHVKVALNKGFHDNNSRNAPVFPIFELASLSQLFSAANQLHRLIFTRNVIFEGRDIFYREVDGALWGSMDLEEQFSENLCSKLLPLAENLYQDGMPPHYTIKVHQEKLEAALKYLSLNSRGPSVGGYRKRLVGRCEGWWRDGREGCESVSSMGNPCVCKLHDVPMNGDEEDEEEDERKERRIKKRQNNKSRNHFTKNNDDGDDNDDGGDDNDYEDDDEKDYDYNNDDPDNEDDDDDDEKDEEDGDDDNDDRLRRWRHTSKLRYRVTCDCGGVQVDRDDPFVLKEANHNIFERLRDRCCHKHGVPYVFDMVDEREELRRRSKKRFISSPSHPSKDSKSNAGLKVKQDQRSKEYSKNRSNNMSAQDDASLSLGLFAGSNPSQVLNMKPHDDENKERTAYSQNEQRTETKQRTEKGQRSQIEQRTNTADDVTPASGCKSNDFILSMGGHVAGGYNGNDEDEEDDDEFDDDDNDYPRNNKYDKENGLDDDEDEDDDDDDDDDDDVMGSNEDLYDDYNSLLRRNNDDEYDDDEGNDDYDIEIKPYEDDNDDDNINHMSRKSNDYKKHDDNKQPVQNDDDEEEDGDGDNDGGDDSDDVMYCSLNMTSVSYSSWSLIRIGKYEPGRGIHQPNYTHQSSYLLPITLINSTLLPSATRHSKCYVGLEYHCSKGHRFLISSPHKLFKAPLSGVFKETGNRLIKKDTPLYFACSCRSGPNYMAQLNRIHIAVAETNEYVVKLKVRIRPNPQPCPIFAPENKAPITLKPGWWVLRLPYAYYDGVKSHPQPNDQSLMRNCKLLKEWLSFVQNKF